MYNNMFGRGRNLFGRGMMRGRRRMPRQMMPQDGINNLPYKNEPVTSTQTPPIIAPAGDETPPIINQEPLNPTQSKPSIENPYGITMSQLPVLGEPMPHETMHSAEVAPESIRNQGGWRNLLKSGAAGAQGQDSLWGTVGGAGGGILADWLKRKFKLGE